MGSACPHCLAAAVYAFAYLFPDGAGTPPNPFDPRFRWAADIYNRSLPEGFASADGKDFEPRARGFELPFGALEVAFDETELLWNNRKLTQFVPVAELEIRGLRNRYRQAGLGAPLSASTVPLQPQEGFQVGPRVKVPVTALLNFPDALRHLASGHVTAKLDLYTPTDADSIPISGQTVPVEAEPSAALAYTLSDPAIWAVELRGFFAGVLLSDLPTRLGALQPYRHEVAAPMDVPHPAPQSGEAGGLQDVAEALDRLPEEQRAVILLVALEGFGYDEVAEILGIPIGTVRSRLSRGRQSLRELRSIPRERPVLRRVK